MSQVLGRHASVCQRSGLLTTAKQLRGSLAVMDAEGRLLTRRLQGCCKAPEPKKGLSGSAKVAAENLIGPLR